MIFEPTELPGVILIKPRLFGDDRGFFMETFRADLFARELGAGFVQDNHSRSARGVLRGLHYQARRPQGKLVRCTAGEIYDVAVDIRPTSTHYGRWLGVRLDAVRHQQLYIPPGFAHGFQVLSEVAEVQYKCTDYYDPGSEGGLAWNDPQLAIDWPIVAPLLSARDQAWPQLGAQTKA